MTTTGLKGRDYLAETDFSREEIESILEVARDLKRERAQGKYHDQLLRAKTRYMIFYNRSLRTRNSFEGAMTQLGGHAHYLDPERIYSPAMAGKEEAFATERVSDVARMLTRDGWTPVTSRRHRTRLVSIHLQATSAAGPGREGSRSGDPEGGKGAEGQAYDPDVCALQSPAMR